MDVILDIRSETVQQTITKIRVADKSHESFIAEFIKNLSNGAIRICDSEASGPCTDVIGKEHAENLIAGLQKAIQLGWVK